MSNIDKHIIGISNAIGKNIQLISKKERGLLSQNILSHLRNLVEHIALKIYASWNDISNSYKNICAAVNFIKSRGDFRFLSKFHDLLQITASHYTLDEECSERLMLKYYEYLLRIKNLCQGKYNLSILDEIYNYPLQNDPELEEYYEKIVEQIQKKDFIWKSTPLKWRYYIQKIKPFFIHNEIYYEVTFSEAKDNVSKFDRIIGFTKFNVLENYAVYFAIQESQIEILGTTMPIFIILDRKVNIRPCEINNLWKILWIMSQIKRSDQEYSNLMHFLKSKRSNLLELVTFDENYYSITREWITTDIKEVKIFNLLDKCRRLILEDKPGKNILRYLLYMMNNVILKRQYNEYPCDYLSNLFLNRSTIPFDNIPLNMSLVNHNPKSWDLFHCIDSREKKDELLARYVKNRTETDGNMFIPLEDLKGFGNIEENISKYNSKLYKTHKDSSLMIYKNYIYIKSYESNIYEIFQNLKKLSDSGVQGYGKSIESWLKNSIYKIDSEEKELILKNLFIETKVVAIYGAAWTWKSTMINHISHFFSSNKKLYLANTHPAVDNLRRKVNADNKTLMTVASFLSKKNQETKFDLVFIDECSTIRNADLLNVLKKVDCQVLVLAGDPSQIESIGFGNRFPVLRKILPKKCIYELKKPFRSQQADLLSLWSKVRWLIDNIQDSDLLEHLTRNWYSHRLDDSIFNFLEEEEDQVILALNYDGLYGINNINRFLQGNNPQKPNKRWVYTYKVNDPILFNETTRFWPEIYNNLKGKILDIQLSQDRIQFDIEVDRVLNALQIIEDSCELLDNEKDGKSTIRFSVYATSEEDLDNDSVKYDDIPFQVAYATSIHKAQGLEYNSVKIIITEEVDEMITYNIFYTAITRAKEKLVIYRSPEVEKRVLSNLKKKSYDKDLDILKSIYKTKDTDIFM